MTRRWFNVGVVKIPHAERDVAHDVLGDRPDDAMWQDIVGADTPDDDERFPVGSNCTYRAALTDEEAARFEAASNCRYVSEDVVIHNVTAGVSTLPGWRCRSYTGYWPQARTQLPGTAVPVAIHDTGTSSTCRSSMSHTLVARGVFVSPAPPANESYPDADHGSLCASTAIPFGGQLLDAVMIGVNPDGTDFSSDSSAAQAITWSVNNGAKVCSGSYTLGTNPMPASIDALNAAAGSDIVFYFAVGNEGLNVMRNPSAFCTSIPYVYSVGGYDMTTDYRWMSNGLASNYHTDMTGCAPSIMVHALVASGGQAEWMGTSAACPQAAGMCARLISGGVTARQAGAALAATVVDKGHGAHHGGGWFHLRRAAEYLGLNVGTDQANDMHVGNVTRTAP